MLSLNLEPIFKIRGIEKPYTFLVRAGFSPHTATTILNSKTRMLRLEHIERLCDILLCEPNDLFTWTPAERKKYPGNYPLSKLKQQPTGTGWAETISTMPYSELKEATKTIIGNLK